jgi:hypothetical protein
VIDNFGEGLFDVRGVGFRIAGFQRSRFHNSPFLVADPKGRRYGSTILPGWLNVNWEKH